MSKKKGAGQRFLVPAPFYALYTYLHCISLENRFFEVFHFEKDNNSNVNQVQCY